MVGQRRARVSPALHAFTIWLQNGEALRSAFGWQAAYAQFCLRGGNVGASTALIAPPPQEACSVRAVAEQVRWSSWPSSQILIVAVGQAPQGIDVEELHLTAKREVD